MSPPEVQEAVGDLVNSVHRDNEELGANVDMTEVAPEPSDDDSLQELPVGGRAPSRDDGRTEITETRLPHDTRTDEIIATNVDANMGDKRSLWENDSLAQSHSEAEPVSGEDLRIVAAQKNDEVDNCRQERQEEDGAWLLPRIGSSSDLSHPRHELEHTGHSRTQGLVSLKHT